MHAPSPPIDVRPLAARDSIEAITALLHRAYAPLADSGLNFTAATQTAESTRRRAAEGQCLVAECQGEIVGTVTVSGPLDAESAPWTIDAPWYRDPDTAHCQQLAVDPRWQRRGIGRGLLAACEQWARDCGYRRLALDTAEPATALRALYRRLGYSEIGQVQWPGKTYRTVAMRKALDRSPLGDQLQLMARYNLWAMRKLLAPVLALPEADYRRDIGLPSRSVHGSLNRLLVGQQLLWFRRFSEGRSDVQRMDVEAEADRERLAQRLVDGALAWLPLLDVWPEERLHGRVAYRRITGPEVSLPFASTLLHVFNHGTHHRSQVVAGLAVLGQPAPPIDLVFMLQEENQP
jgi:uncharacterized damage-inducible protein DinB/GNAT superfamily N-acetyltransferase